MELCRDYYFEVVIMIEDEDYHVEGTLSVESAACVVHTIESGLEESLKKQNIDNYYLKSIFVEYEEPKILS